ncbi:MAG TPA: chromosome segregation protein SMC [Candidatus Hydrogenedentes bacterium]|nr:chromosome segregation protein SMC [Candidatus Hydrogenedentota bacterium]HQM48240.1 chromosome segregation protein SMC [Candidatus Hydrogenedentota bacterium]
MYFKQLELSGFKSFADHTVVRFEPGVTVIVGPNGCGKSNILDAMKWCLGEQRAKELRGSLMQDVIFNGSENRNPTGMAEVTLLFDNSDSNLPVDFAEVAVTRRLYRSGESEYLLNSAPCRLKDIQELFMDTGIGTSAYSMVGQGKMDLILSSKPEDRRFLFEEAAGIIKYKNRKRAALRKLESAENNLLRLSDIIAEVQRQMRSLKRQVNAAIRYRELTAMLRDIEIRAAWLKYRTLTSEIDELKKRFAEATDEYEAASTKTSELEARFEELGLAKLEQDRVLLARREGVHQIDSEMEKLEREIALTRQQMAFSEEQEKRAETESADFEQRAEAIADHIERTRAARENAQGELDACSAAIEAKAQEHGALTGKVAEADVQLEAKRALAVEKMNTRAKAATELETLAVTIFNIESQLESIYENQKRIGQRREELLEALGQQRGQEAEKQARLTESEAGRTRTQRAQADKTQALRSLDQEWQSLREKKSSLAARLTSLRELRDNYEGFAAGVRAVMRAKADGQGGMQDIIGPVGDLLSTGKEYERAIEAALGGNINNVVTEHAGAAKGAIEFLKENQAGRVTFLPLDILRSPIREALSLTGRQGVVGDAISFVQFDGHIRPAVEYLLRDTVVVETLDDAIRIAREEQSYPRLVTLDGEVVQSSGAVTGGRTRHDRGGLLGRSAEIAELEKQLIELEGQLSEMADSGQALGAEIQELTSQIHAFEAAESAIRRELGDIGVAIARQSAELDGLVQSAQELDAQRDELCTRRDGLEDQRRQASARADTMASDDEAIQHEIAEAQESASRARQALSVCASQLADLRVRQAGIAQRIQEIDRDVEREQARREEALDEARRRRETIVSQQETRKRLEGDIRLHLERSSALSESKEQARKKVIDAENQRQTLLDESETLEKELRELRETARGAQSRVHETELALRQREDRVGFFQERILDEYNIALASLREDEVGTDEYSLEERDKLVNDVRGRLQRMGEVNLMAIEEYEALEKRESFLTTQYNDLQSARETLLGVIARSDKKILSMFMETFTLVGDHFRNYFRTMFSGGQARIYLLDEDDPLESGIEIEARPPGKKLQSISLLSGGEQAMTALALLFSIFRAKPSPFCVLDEVDAPLDDANIGRFLSMLDEFTKESQFVVISHNKQTMARGDALYGVTMQERGVSQLVSVRFKDGKEPADSAA